MAPAPEERALNLASGGSGDKVARPAWSRWAPALLSGPVALAIAQLAGAVPEATEAVYGQRVGPWIGWLLARATGWIPFSLAEWLLVAALVFWVARWARAARSHRRLRSLGRATLLNLRDLSVVLAVFTLVFGIQYRRQRPAKKGEHREHDCQRRDQKALILVGSRHRLPPYSMAS